MLKGVFTTFIVVLILTIVSAAEGKTLEKLEVEYVRNLRIGFRTGVISNIQGSNSSVISTVGKLVFIF